MFQLFLPGSRGRAVVVAAIVAAVTAMLLVVMGKVYQVIRSWN